MQTLDAPEKGMTPEIAVMFLSCKSKQETRTERILIHKTHQPQLFAETVINKVHVTR